MRRPAYRVGHNVPLLTEATTKSRSINSNDSPDFETDKTDSSSSVSINPIHEHKKGPWSQDEDKKLSDYVRKYGEGNWKNVEKRTGLKRCGKSCRLRWSNHLKPGLRKGSFSPEEENMVIRLHYKWGNKWSQMTRYLPGRTDNEIKNFWNTRLKRLQRSSAPLYPAEVVAELEAEENQEAQATLGFSIRRDPLITITNHVGESSGEKLVGSSRNAIVVRDHIPTTPTYPRSSSKNMVSLRLRSLANGDSLDRGKRPLQEGKANPSPLYPAQQPGKGHPTMHHRTFPRSFSTASVHDRGSSSLSSVRLIIGRDACTGGCSQPPPACPSAPVELPSLQLSAFDADGSPDQAAWPLSYLASPSMPKELSPPLAPRGGTGLLDQIVQEGYARSSADRDLPFEDESCLLIEDPMVAPLQISHEYLLDTASMMCASPLSSQQNVDAPGLHNNNSGASDCVPAENPQEKKTSHLFQLEAFLSAAPSNNHQEDDDGMYLGSTPFDVNDYYFDDDVKSLLYSFTSALDGPSNHL